MSKAEQSTPGTTRSQQMRFNFLSSYTEQVTTNKKIIYKKWEEGWARGLFSFELTRKREREKRREGRGGGIITYKNTSLLQADVAEADTAGIRHASLGNGHGGFGRSMSPAVRCRD